MWETVSIFETHLILIDSRAVLKKVGQHLSFYFTGTNY